jgi:hypothetical protein
MSNFMRLSMRCPYLFLGMMISAGFGVGGGEASCAGAADTTLEAQEATGVELVVEFEVAREMAGWYGD